jgi:hypothetical protein
MSVEVAITVQASPAVEISPDQPTITIRQVGIQGPVGPAGPSGSGGGASFDYTQAVAASTWTIPHNLGFFPVVDVRTVGGLLVLADVQHLSVNVAVVTLLAPMTGTARLT